ncbi:hypothetical protein [Geomonas subterranea]|uniref:Lipoprotein n=1 Tax=Geomonas subterranea TaxID=2847989 RepID=A0ABX8LJ14_9BACT|nr:MULTISPECIES: hypothetical protein [Geomonas]QXE90644.1 hypothetical protein KP001_19955 [Geomonas subterranea]QXM11276.1 hypothetical protein KP002_09330 [Geomonas subterranea]
MRTLFRLALLMLATSALFGCAHNYYNIPQETLEKKVRTIGVAPFFTDAESDIKHPEKPAILSIVRGYNFKNEKELVARIRSTGIFYAVRPVTADPDRLFTSLVWNREKRDDAGIIYNKYFFKKDDLKQLMTENGLDAVLFVTVSGLTKPAKVYSSNLFSYLETDYNYLSMSAVMLDREGTTIWEYPNFRRQSPSYPMFFSLQYPDFDEAAANLTDKVDVKFKTVAGVNAAFAKSEPSSVPNGPEVSTLYVKQFDEMLALMQTYQPLFGAKEKEKETPPAPANAPVYYTPPAPPATPAPAAPATVTPQAVAPAPAPKVAAPAAPAAPAGPAPITSVDIVPEQPAAK